MDFVGIDKLSLLDYEDKISCVLFTKACNFRCPFCHNGLSVIESETFIPFDDILDYLKMRRGVLDAVVISGGEPTLMPDLIDKIKIIKELGYEVKLDTNGTNPEIVEKLINEKLIDYVAMDIKNSLEMYALTAGVKTVNLENIKKTIHLLNERDFPHEFRTTLVYEFHNDEKYIHGIGELIKGSKKLYLQKFVDREGVFKKGLHPVEEDLANKYKDILSKYVDSVELRGY